MTQEQIENIKRDIQKVITHIARVNNVYDDEVETVISNMYTNKLLI